AALPGAETAPFGPPTPVSEQGSPLPSTVREPALSRRYFWWAGAIVVLVGFAAGLLTWWPHRSATPDPPTPDPIGVWMNLLDRRPVPLLWPSTEVPPSFENDRQRLLVSCEGHGLLRLGEVSLRTAYKLQIGFRQPQWTGGV